MVFDDAVYGRGAMALQALRNRVGDQVFWRIIHTWIREQRGGNGSTEEFEEVAARVSGQDLGSFFTAWLRARPPSRRGPPTTDWPDRPMPDVSWFRAPADDDPGTLNACYDALDIHVIRGRAEEIALVGPAATGPSRAC
jgi:hypothetical protein